VKPRVQSIVQSHRGQDGKGFTTFERPAHAIVFLAFSHNPVVRLFRCVARDPEVSGSAGGMTGDVRLLSLEIGDHILYVSLAFDAFVGNRAYVVYGLVHIARPEDPEYFLDGLLFLILSHPECHARELPDALRKMKPVQDQGIGTVAEVFLYVFPYVLCTVREEDKMPVLHEMVLKKECHQKPECGFHTDGRDDICPAIRLYVDHRILDDLSLLPGAVLPRHRC